MTKEHLIEHYGTLRYTIGTGCSGGLARRAVDRQRLSRHLPGDPADLLVPRRVEHGDAVPRLPPDAALLREPDSVGRRRGVDANADGGRRGRSRRRRERAGLRRRAVPRRDPDRSMRGRHRPAALRPDDQPRRRALHDPGRGDQRLRTAAEVGVDAAGAADRPRVRRHAGGQRRRAVRPRRRCSRARSRRPSSSTSTRRSAASTPTRTTRRDGSRANQLGARATPTAAA